MFPKRVKLLNEQPALVLGLGYLTSTPAYAFANVLLTIAGSLIIRL